MTMLPSYSETNRVLVLTVGLPASGKSTWAKELIASDPSRWRRVSRDDLRLMLWNGSNGSNADEKSLTETEQGLVKSLLESGKDVVVDAMNLKASYRKAFHLIAESVGNCTVIEKVIPCPLELAVSRNAYRTGPAAVPTEVITDLTKRFHVAADGSFKNIKDSVTEYKAVESKTVVQDENLPPALIVDLDGTLCLIGKRNRYDASRCEEDTVNQPVLDVLEAASDGHLCCKIIFMSGRSDKYRPETERWLARHVRSPRVYNYRLFMRADSDKRKDSIVKQELFEKHVKGKYNVKFVLDDRGQVVSMFRSLGLTVFQVAEGNF